MQRIWVNFSKYWSKEETGSGGEVSFLGDKGHVMTNLTITQIEAFLAATNPPVFLIQNDQYWQVHAFKCRGEQTLILNLGDVSQIFNQCRFSQSNSEIVINSKSGVHRLLRAVPIQEVRGF